MTRVEGPGSGRPSRVNGSGSGMRDRASPNFCRLPFAEPRRPFVAESHRRRGARRATRVASCRHRPSRTGRPPCAERSGERPGAMASADLDRPSSLIHAGADLLKAF